tara:strand:+ start:5532 stop:6266 length:735 start_codon:yes stop_codon:yes gene_type:complete
MNLAIIIARGGSKRLPRKNVRDFCGHPLLAWSIRQAKTSREIDYTVMATDDSEIAQISRKYKIDEVIMHPEWEESALRTFVYTIKELADRTGNIEAVATILPPAPLRLPGDIDRLVKNYYNTGAHSMSAMSRVAELALFQEVSPWICRCVGWDKNRKHMLNSLGISVRSPGFIMNQEALYADLTIEQMDAEVAAGNMMSELFFTETEPWQIYETDTLEDFELCELLMEHYILKGRTMEEVYVNG